MDGHVERDSTEFNSDKSVSQWARHKITTHNSQSQKTAQASKTRNVETTPPPRT
jgi:hypothetical protein